MSQWHLDDPVLRSLRNLIPLVGATQYVCGEFPEVFEQNGIRPRDPVRNDYLGMTMSHPREAYGVFGFAYIDNLDGRHDEDIYELEIDSGDLVKFTPGDWENRRPEYEGTHHGDKRYLTLDDLGL